MTITEALKLTQRAPSDAPVFHVVLACGFTPLHMQTFLGGHLQQLLPKRRVVVKTGLYGDVAGSLQTASACAAQAVVVPLEWSDLDPRLGFREGGRWNPAAVPDILDSARAALERIALALEALPPEVSAAISRPTLPLPGLFHTAGWQASRAEVLLEEAVAAFTARLSRHAVVNVQRLGEASPPRNRYDFKSDLLTGLPYTLSHADALANQMALLIAPPASKKGLITDLDDTLWHGIVGEIGAGTVSWDLSSHHSVHGLYQRLLACLAEEGVLVAIASKNDAVVVQQALERADLHLRPERVFPIEVHWQAKSASVRRILSAWNVAAESVVFVDDSPMELAEVAAEHPGIECVLFPKDDYTAIFSMLRRLRDLFGKAHLSDADNLRLESLRRNVEFQAGVSEGATSEAFLAGVSAVMTIDFAPAADDARVLELVNKTNQFNLNGIRFTDADWHRRTGTTGSVTAVVAYEDKFGPLGKIAVLQGRLSAGTLYLDTWVMSCRAFARRIEHQCLRVLFDALRVESVWFDFAPTAKNSPLRDFLASLAGLPPDTALTITRSQFDDACPPLYHEVRPVNVPHTTCTTSQIA